MANFKLIYQILSILDGYLDDEDPDLSKLTPENLFTNKKRFTCIMIMLLEAGYIDGVRVVHVAKGMDEVKLINPSITLKGLEYLEENTMMKKVYRMLKGIKDVTPGV